MRCRENEPEFEMTVIWAMDFVWRSRRRCPRQVGTVKKMLPVILGSGQAEPHKASRAAEVTKNLWEVCGCTCIF
jgi:hypothetical protein